MKKTKERMKETFRKMRERLLKMTERFRKKKEKPGEMPEQPRKTPGKPRKLPRRKKWLAIGAVLLLAVFCVSRVFGAGKHSGPSVSTVTPVRDTVQEKLSVSGPVSGTDSVDVVSSLHAEVLKLLVSEGDKVEAGQVLAVLDDTDIRKDVDMAENDYNLAMATYEEMAREAERGYEKALQDYQTAQANYDRMKVLFDGGSIPQVDLETAGNALNDARRQRDSYILVDGQAAAPDSYRLQAEKARFDYEKKQKQLEDTQVKAPIAGTVTRVNTKVGRFADQTGDSHEPLFVIENLDALEMEIQISEYSIGKVKVGQQAVISADILDGSPVEGEVVSISPTGEEKSGGSNERVIPTRIRIKDKNSKLIAGITARAEIVLSEAEDALCVPATALLDSGGQTYVQAVQKGAVHWISVTCGVEGDLMTEVFPAEGEALDESTQIIAMPAEAYGEGTAVTVTPQ